MSNERRAATLLAFIRALEASAQDDVLDMFDLLITRMFVDAIRKGRKKPIVHPGKAADSVFIRILRHPKADQRMPLDADPLPDETVAVLTRWVNAGLPEGSMPAEVAAPVTTGRPHKRVDVVV